MQDMRSRTEQLKPTCLAKWFEFFMASNIDAPEHRKNYNVAGFFSGVRVSGRRSRHKETKSRAECENGGKRDWREEATMDGNAPVVETLAQDGSQMDREMQLERLVCHQRTSTQLGGSCGQKSARKP